MKKIIVIIGSPRRGETYKAVQEFERELKSHEDMDFECVFLCDYNLGQCRGCCLCFERGEQFCPQKDDRDVLLGKMMAADGVVFATPNYALNVTATMKIFFDRLAFIFHRPRFFYKASTAIVVQAVYGGEDILKYLKEVSEFWGFRVTHGTVITAMPGVRLPAEQQKIDRKISGAADRFYRTLSDTKAYKSSLKRLAIFRASRTSIKTTDKNSADYKYYEQQGWLNSDFYCKASLNPMQKLAGSLVDRFVAGQIEKTKREQEDKSGSKPS